MANAGEEKTAGGEKAGEQQMPAHAAPPSITRQMNFIMENSNILNRETKLTIQHIVMQEVGKEAMLENSGTREVDVDLDYIGANNPEALLQIYNIVRARLDLLNRPVGKAAEGNAAVTQKKAQASLATGKNRTSAS